MVNVGFIVEGHCEQAVLSSLAFQSWLKVVGVLKIGEVSNAVGKSNLGTEVAASLAQILRDKGAERIVILRDLDDLPDLEAAKQEVIQANDISLCVAVRELEAWFLADSEALSAIFKTNFHFELPEQESKPSEKIDQLSRQFRQGRGLGDKRRFTTLMLANGFSIERAAEHPNCPSARYFLTTLKTLASANASAN